jgi:hypothetical protein
MPDNNQPTDNLTELLIALDDSLLDITPATSQSSIPIPHQPSTPSPPPDPTSPPHVTTIAFPVDLWHILQTVLPYRGIKSFVVSAVREKLAQPHLPQLLAAARALLRITEQLLLTTPDPPPNADQALSELHEALKHFD